jgi:hypothetical protein
VHWKKEEEEDDDDIAAPSANVYEQATKVVSCLGNEGEGRAHTEGIVRDRYASKL